MNRGNQIPNQKPTLSFLLGPSWYFHLIWAAYTNSKNYINSYTTKGLPVYKYQQRGNSDDVEKASIRTICGRPAHWRPLLMTIKFKAIRTVLKKFFVTEVCLLLSANINTVHFEQMFVKTLILLVISNNLAFQQVSSPGAGASVVTASDSDFPPNVACFHRLPGKHWKYCTGLPSCFWSPTKQYTLTSVYILKSVLSTTVSSDVSIQGTTGSCYQLSPFYELTVTHL